MSVSHCPQDVATSSIRHRSASEPPATTIDTTIHEPPRHISHGPGCRAPSRTGGHHVTNNDPRSFIFHGDKEATAGAPSADICVSLMRQTNTNGEYEAGPLMAPSATQETLGAAEGITRVEIVDSHKSYDTSNTFSACRAKERGTWLKVLNTTSADLASTKCLAITNTSDTSESPDHDRYRPAPYEDVKRYAKFPAASRQREITKSATRFASSGRGLFVHYVTPVLRTRREALIRSDTTKKKYHKSAEQLWRCLPDEEQFFWQHKAKELRVGLKTKPTNLGEALDQKLLTAEQCLNDAGFADEWFEYRRFAEIRVAAYLNLDLPEEFEQLHTNPSECAASVKASSASTKGWSASSCLLPVLPEPFDFQPCMMYGNFAHADYEEIKRLEGKQQAARLRQLADQLDPTGKEFFYYYAFPHLWRLRPLDIGQTVASEAHAVWRSLDVKRRTLWKDWSTKAKKSLGDGNVDGITSLELNSMEEDVLALRRLTVDALGARTMPVDTEICREKNPLTSARCPYLSCGRC